MKIPRVFLEGSTLGKLEGGEKQGRDFAQKIYVLEWIELLIMEWIILYYYHISYEDMEAIIKLH